MLSLSVKTFNEISVWDNPPTVLIKVRSIVNSLLDKRLQSKTLLNKVSNDQELIDSLNLDKLPNGKSDESGGGEQTEADNEAPEDEEDMGGPGMDFGM